MIRPALSAKEWARLAAGPVFVGADGGLEFSYDDGQASEPLDDTLGVAALCLHGRISWEMVDALEAVAGHIAASTGDGEYVWARWCDDHTQLRDLLESLLPPRETPQATR